MNDAPSLAERFWSKVDVTEEDECWNWTASADRFGRGRIWANGRSESSPRIAWELHHGRAVPRSLLVLHTCDNPRCCNPKHLWTGTYRDNMLDMVEKGRMGLGSVATRFGSDRQPERAPRDPEKYRERNRRNAQRRRDRLRAMGLSSRGKPL